MSLKSRTFLNIRPFYLNALTVLNSSTVIDSLTVQIRQTEPAVGLFYLLYILYNTYSQSSQVFHERNNIGDRHDAGMVGKKSAAGIMRQRLYSG